MSYKGWMIMERYSRQTLFHPIGSEGQKKLMNSRVLIIGAGALGTASADMMVRAGIGSMTIVDRDYVEYSNLQRQQLYTEQDAKEGAPKAKAAAHLLGKINQDVTITPYVMDVLDFAAREKTDTFDLYIDATDNFETRLFLNDLAQKKPYPLDLWRYCRQPRHNLYHHTGRDTLFLLYVTNTAAIRRKLRYCRCDCSHCTVGHGPTNDRSSQNFNRTVLLFAANVIIL